MINYSCGFLFDEKQRHVVLLQKGKPDWMKGKWNGIGGKIEPNETAYEAMVREFKEEAGLEIKDWEQFLVLTDNKNFQVNFFKAFVHLSKLHEVRTMETEKVAIHTVSYILNQREVASSYISNVPWLIRMAITYDPYVAQYHITQVAT